VKKLMPRLDGFRDPAFITSPVRGLLLVRTKGGYFVYNPSTGSSLLLPDTIAPLKRCYRYKTSTQPHPPCFHHLTYGLGYCSVFAELHTYSSYTKTEQLISS
jgi:hypothetical protein